MGFLPEGIIRIHGAPRDRGPEGIARENKTENLTQFFDANNPRVVRTNSLESGTRLSLYLPTQPWSELHLMITASPEDISQVPPTGISIYNLPQDAQETYWQYTLTTMITLQDAASSHKDFSSLQIIAMENCGYVLPGTRSIALPHIQVTGVLPSWIDITSSPNTPKLPEQQRLLHRTQQRLARGVATKMNQSHAAAFYFRDTLPYGYSLTFIKPVQQILADPKEFAQTLALHHHVLTHILTHSTRRHTNVVPQPAYALFITIDNGLVTVRISPKIYAFAGPFESLNIQLLRGPEFEQREIPQSLHLRWQNMANVLLDQIS